MILLPYGGESKKRKKRPKISWTIGPDPSTSGYMIVKFKTRVPHQIQVPEGTSEKDVEKIIKKYLKEYRKSYASSS